MKAILILACAVLAMVLLGWLRFANYPDHSSIHIETQKIKSDTQQAIDQGEKALDDLGHQTQKLLKK